jgi:hypothetical protein
MWSLDLLLLKEVWTSELWYYHGSHDLCRSFLALLGPAILPLIGMHLNVGMIVSGFLLLIWGKVSSPTPSLKIFAAADRGIR